MKKNKTKKAIPQTFSLRPLADRVVIEEIVEVAEKETKSGIFIPESATKDSGSKKGTVVAVGPGKYDDGKFIAPSIKVGDTVLFQWGEKIEVKGVEYYVVREGEILAVVTR